MSRTGVEDKPAWRVVPIAVRRQVDAVLGKRVVRAARVWGGYGPSPTYRLRLADGTGAFFKAVWPHSNDFQIGAHARELLVYRELHSVIAAWAPRFLGEFDCDGWRVMLLEDLGPKTAPPWTPKSMRRVAHGLADLHLATQNMSFPAWLPRMEEHGVLRAQLWQPSTPVADLHSVASAAGKYEREARRWLRAHVARLSDSAAALHGLGAPHCLMHLDVRSDNLRVVGGCLRLFDWPHAGVGAPEFDAAAWAQTVPIEGGPDADTVMGWYRAKMPVRDEVLTSAVAALSGYFADAASRPEIPGLPRVRFFQRAQLRVTLRWAAARLQLPAPTWLDGLQTQYRRRT